MDLKVLGQPYREPSATGQTFLTNALADQDVDQVLVITAWVRESGLQLLAPGIQALRDRGGTARLLFGVDLQGTSRQGVDLARTCFTAIHAVHDPAGGTFHPKVYLAFGSTIGYALVGSNNLTAGGLWHNYEAAILATFDPRREPDILDGIRGYADRLLADRAICRKVTTPVFRRLVSEGWLADEAADRRRRNEDRPSRTSRRTPRGVDPLFSPSQVEKRSRPAPMPHTERPVSRRKRRRLALAPDAWWKQLSAGDAQHPPVGNPTGNVTLVGVPTGYERNTYFRRVFFGAERWRTQQIDGKTSELATICAEVEIGSDRLGECELTVLYRAYRSERGRATTVLRWGETLLAELDRRDLTGAYLLIERADLRTYRLRVVDRQPA